MNRAYLFSVVAAAFALTMTVAPAGDAKKSDSVVKVKAKLEKAPAGKAVVVLNLEIEPNWHLYANPVGNQDLEGSRVVVKIDGTKAAIDYPPGKVVDDSVLGKYKIYRGKIEIRATVDRATSETSPINVDVKLYACSEKPLKEVCLPPSIVKVSVR